MAARATPQRLWPLLSFGRGESPTSLLSRLARLHGRNPVQLCRDFTLSYRGIVEGAATALASFGRLVGVDPMALKAEALRKVGERRWEFKGEAVIGSTLSRATKRVCSLCLLADAADAAGDRHAAHHAYGRSIWALNPIRACPHHGVSLVAVAGGGGHPSETHDFAGAVAPLLEDPPALERLARPAPPSAMEDYLLGRLAGRRSGGWLDGLAWHAAADACQSLGAVTLHGAKVRLLEMDEDDWRAAGDAGHAVACNGEDGIRNLLSRLDTDFEGSRMSKDGPQARYGSAFKRLAFTSEERDFDPLREIMKRHVLETTAVGPEDKMFGVPFERRVLHSVHSAALAYGVHPKRLRTILVAKGVLDAGTATLTDERCVFSASENDALLWTCANSVSLTEAETRLGAGRVQAKLLADAGIIRPFVELVRTWRGEENYAAPELDAFLVRLLGRAQAVDQAPPGSYDIPAAAKRANCSAIEIVRLVLDRRLEWTGRLDGVSGYMSVLVDLDEVKRHVQGPAREGLTARELEKRLRATTRTVAALIDHGHLPTSTIAHPVNRCPTQVVDPTDVESFETTYISLNRLADERGMHFRRMKKTIEAAGVRPAFTRDVYHATFYKRTDMAAV